MGTTPPRKLHVQTLHAMRGRVTFSDTGIATGIEIGKIPAGSFVDSVSVSVEVVFNALTTNVLTVGSAADDDGFATAAGTASTAAGQKRGLTGAQSGNIAADTSVLVKYTQTGTAATTGVADVVLYFYPHPT